MAKRAQVAGATKAADYSAQIAEAAYYKAERRGFEPGYEMTDWLEAERELEAGFKTTRSGKKPRKTASKAAKAKKSVKS
jgi:RNA 3'-terminal phosphate cyclase